MRQSKTVDVVSSTGHFPTEDECKQVIAMIATEFEIHFSAITSLAIRKSRLIPHRCHSCKSDRLLIGARFRGGTREDKVIDWCPNCREMDFLRSAAFSGLC